ncbi:MAG: hypothetical protein PHQ75_01595, partial [Thermoguttaceae bacterium]|nr:hypothetical protein [Thermoguttaceae bacterium]
MRRQGVFNFTSELGDFSSCILEKYQEKVVEQTLFDNFDPNVCTVLQYLCSLSYLEKCYKSFRRRESAVSCRSLSENVGGKTNTTLGDTIASDEMTSDEKLIRHERCKKVTALLESLNSMIVHCPAPGTVVYNQTGLQLYPRLSTTNPEMVKLCDFSQAFVANTKNVSQSESDDVIRKTHVAAQTKWNRKYEEISGKLYRSTLSGLAKRREWRDQINEIFAEQYFRPLEPPAIS